MLVPRDFTKKGECIYILIDNIKYYTKECIKLSKIMLLGLLIIGTIILIKYKPMYSVNIGSEKIGYTNNINNIDNYIEEVRQDEKIAFAELKEQLIVKPRLVNRNTQNYDEQIKEKVADNLTIEYTSYAVTYKSENIAYVKTMEEAEEVIKKLKEENSSEEVGILQVYSDNYEQIAAADSKDDAVTKVSDKIKDEIEEEERKKEEEREKERIKLASIKKSNQTTQSSEKISGISLSKPLNGTITSRYGGRSSPGGIGSTNHKGLDIAAKAGTTIKAAASGTIKFSGYKGSLGNLVIIDNGNGVETYYGHCSKLLVSAGEKVESGDTIAAVGSTGAATGPHLHFEVHINGKAVSPHNDLY